MKFTVTIVTTTDAKKDYNNVHHSFKSPCIKLQLKSHQLHFLLSFPSL